jgi:uncharacterized protein
MDETPDPATLLARAAKLRLFVMLRQTRKPDMLANMLGDHLRWMIDREKEGLIFLSGPILPRQGSIQLDGLTIIRAADPAQAHSIATQDPFVQNEIVSFELFEWIVNEGAIPLTITLSDSTARIG